MCSTTYDIVTRLLMSMSDGFPHQTGDSVINILLASSDIVIPGIGQGFVHSYFISIERDRISFAVTIEDLPSIGTSQATVQLS